MTDDPRGSFKSYKRRQSVFEYLIYISLGAIGILSLVWAFWYVERLPPPPPFRYIGETTSDGVIQYLPDEELLCPGDNLLYAVSVEVIRPAGDVEVKYKIVRRPSGENVPGTATYSERTLVAAATYTNEPRVYLIPSDLSPGDYWLSGSASTPATEGGLYVVPFRVGACD